MPWEIDLPEVFSIFGTIFFGQVFDQVFGKVFVSFLARFLTSFLARFLTRVFGQENTVYSSTGTKKTMKK